MDYLDFLEDGVMVIDERRNIVFVNKFMLKSLNLPPEKIIGRKCHEINHSLNHPCRFKDFVCPHEEIFSQKKRVRTIHEHASPEGPARYIEISASPVQDETGKVIHVVEVLRDVTEREKSRRILLKSNEANVLLRELSDAFLADGDMEGTLEETLKKLTEFYGANSVIISLADKWRPFFTEAGWSMRWNTPEIEDTETPFGESYTNKETIFIKDVLKETRLKIPVFIKNQGMRSGLWVPIAEKGDGESIGVLCLLFKTATVPLVSELWAIELLANNIAVYAKKERAFKETHEAEEFSSSILEGIGEGVVVVDRDFRIISANRGYIGQVKLEPEKIHGRHCYEVSHHIERPCFEEGEECAVKNVFETGSSKRAVHTHFDKNGEPLYIQTIAYPLRDPKGRLYAAVEVLEDVTERVNLEKEVNDKMKELMDFYDMAVDRELRMKELKEEVGSLRAEIERLRKTK